jgi:nicotinate phosphoribosyltransferase
MLYSFLDDDLYKFTMQAAVLRYFPQAQATYRFTLRRKVPFVRPAIFMTLLNSNIKEFSRVQITPEELQYLKGLNLFNDDYLAYLATYRFDPNQVRVAFDAVDLGIEIVGPWHSTILWEVRLMALISQTYFGVCDTEWKLDEAEIENKLQKKASILDGAGAKFADFGTRRRRHFVVQDLAVSLFSRTAKNFVGTSNVHLAMKYGVKPIGTMAHEWIMGTSGLVSLRHANKTALENWASFYRGKLGIALTDTFTTDAFFKDFDGYIARLYDGVRHDSGDPYKFADKVVAHYKTLGIDPSTKTIVFSDGLNPEECVKIKMYCDQLGIRSVYGIGTNFTNDFEGSKALNMVIKLRSIDGVDVIKLSDEPGKATGEESALAEARHVFLGKAICGKE